MLLCSSTPRKSIVTMTMMAITMTILALILALLTQRRTTLQHISPPTHLATPTPYPHSLLGIKYTQ